MKEKQVMKIKSTIQQEQVGLSKKELKAAAKAASNGTKQYK